MSFILKPEAGSEVYVNGWNWRPTVVLLSTAGLLSDEQYERMGLNGCGGRASAEQVTRFADAVSAQVAKMKQGERMRADLSVTSSPKPINAETNELYSASHEWLIQFRDFCQTSGGFKVL